MGQKGCEEFRGGCGKAERAQGWWEGCDCQKFSTSVAWCRALAQTLVCLLNTEHWKAEDQRQSHEHSALESPHQEENPPWQTAQYTAPYSVPQPLQQAAAGRGWHRALSIHRAAPATLADGGQGLIFSKGRRVFPKQFFIMFPQDSRITQISHSTNNYLRNKPRK